MKVLQEVLQEISPNQDERKHTKKLIDAFIKKLSKIRIADTKIIPGGSWAKDTWLAGGHDADIFFAFNYKTYAQQSSRISRLLEVQLKKHFKKYSRLHGSRDYFQIKESNFVFEIIPILNISKPQQALNITDVSTLHTKWVKKNSTKKLRDDIRLAKAFCKAQVLYGAESYIKGLSGYVLEILVIHYGGFMKLLKASQKWKERDVIDAAKHYPNALEAQHSINRSKHSVLMIIDPVDKTRNAAAALGEEKLDLFKKKAASFLKKQDVNFFRKENIDEKTLQKKYKEVFILKVHPLKGKRDVIGSKLLKVFTYLTKELTLFSVKKKGWQWSEGETALFWWSLGKETIDPIELRKGPPQSMKEAASAFRKKHKDTFVKNKAIYARIKRKHSTLKSFISSLIKNGYVKEKVKKIEFI